MVGIGVALVAMTGCGPDPELLERVVRLETQVEDMQAQLAEQAAAAEAPEACAQAKKEAFDAWEAARVVAKKNAANKAKEAADWAAQHHDDEKLDLTDAIAA
jgi:hypothetical protein